MLALVAFEALCQIGAIPYLGFHLWRPFVTRAQKQLRIIFFKNNVFPMRRREMSRPFVIVIAGCFAVQGLIAPELVRSGLDDTMRTAYQAMRKVWHERDDVNDLRMAAYLVSIDRVAGSYRAKGL